MLWEEEIVFQEEVSVYEWARQNHEQIYLGGILSYLQIVNVWILSFYNDVKHTAFWLEPIVKVCEYRNKDNILIACVFLHYVN